LSEYQPNNDAELYASNVQQGESAYEDPLIQDQMAQQDVAADYQEEQEDEQFMGYAEGKPREGLYALFNKVLTLPKTTKVGNVDKQELGELGISIRECLRVALIGKTFGHKHFAAFFENQANIITETSMAKRGWFSELFVTAKKFTERSSQTAPTQLVGVPAEKSDNKLTSFFKKK